MRNKFKLTLNTSTHEMAGWSASVEIGYTIGNGMKCDSWSVNKVHWLRTGKDEQPQAIVEANQEFYIAMVQTYLSFRRNMSATCEANFQWQTLQAA